MIIGVFIVSMLAGIAIGLPIAMALLLCAICTAMAMGGGVAQLYACLTECRFVGPMGLAAYAELSRSEEASCRERV